MVDYSMSRNPSWRFLLLDSNDNPLRDLDEVVTGGCKIESLSRLGGSASLTLRLDPTVSNPLPVNFLTHRFQAIYDSGAPGASPWPVGTYLFTSPTMTHADGYVQYDVALLSKLKIVDEETVGLGYSLPAGANIVDNAVALIRSTGESRIAVTPSSAVLPAQVVWKGGTSKLTIINDLLDAAGYWGLWVDGGGQFRVEPYRLPSARPVAFVFEAGEPRAIHKAGWSREQDLSSVPNVCRVIREGTDDTAGIEGSFTNDDPLSPLSVLPPPLGRGVEISLVVTDVEVETVDQANALANRRLLAAMAPVGKLFVEHAPVPISQNDVVQFSPAAVRASVTNMTYKFDSGALVSSEWREV